MEQEPNMQQWESTSKKKSSNKQRNFSILCFVSYVVFCGLTLIENLQQQRALHAHKKMSSILETCWFCIDNPKADQSMIVSMGDSVYLALPKRGRLVKGIFYVYCSITALFIHLLICYLLFIYFFIIYYLFLFLIIFLCWYSIYCLFLFF
jgi:hypothetical protein